jgi:hypothetical protein
MAILALGDDVRRKEFYETLQFGDVNQPSTSSEVNMETQTEIMSELLETEISSNDNKIAFASEMAQISNVHFLNRDYPKKEAEEFLKYYKNIQSDEAMYHFLMSFKNAIRKKGSAIKVSTTTPGRRLYRNGTRKAQKGGRKKRSIAECS